MNLQSSHKWLSTLSLLCSTRVPSGNPLVGSRDGLACRASLLVRLIHCPIILTASSTRRLLICRPLAIRLLVLPHLPSCSVRLSVSCLGPYGGTNQLGMFLPFLMRIDVLAILRGVTAVPSSGSFPCFAGDWRMAHQFLMSHLPPLLPN